MVYSIFRNNLIIAKVKPNNSSKLVQKKQQDDYIRLDFTLTNFVNFKIGDYIVFEKSEERYYLNKLPGVKESPKNYSYECVFEGGIYELKKVKVFLDTPKTGGGFYRDYKFPLTGNAQTFLDFIVSNLNRAGGSYTAGAYEETNTLTVDFNNWNAFESINSIAALLNFEWYLEGTTLNFVSSTKITSYLFQVGRKTGFLDLTRTRIQNRNIETVVYGYGSTENMPPRTAEEGTTYDSNLLTENRLEFSGVDGESKLTKNKGEYGVRESIQEFDDIKPEFTGTVSAIEVGDLRVFYDTSIDFDINQHLLSDITPKIKFLTGKLIGLTFNIAFEDSTDKITMDYFNDESGPYPNDIIFAEVGDTYKLFDIYMPETYIQDAQIRLEEATQIYIDEESRPLESYTGGIDKEYIQSKNIVLFIGDLVRIISATFEIDSTYEIIELTQNINNPYQYSITFGDLIPLGLLAQLKISNFTTNQKIYSVEKSSVTNNEVTNIVGGETSWQTL